MNKNLIIAGAVVLLIVIGAGAYFMTRNASNSPTSQTPSNESMSGEQNSSPKSIKDLLSAGSSQQCTFTTKVEGADASGTAYVSGGKVRVDSTATVNSATMNTHMIIKDNTSYSWTDGQAMGYMMEFDPNAMSDNDTDTDSDTSSQNMDVNKYVDYSCSGWSADESVFTPPASVKFQSMGSMMGPTGSAGGNQTAPQNNCAMCNYLSGESKTKCLAELQCN